MAENKQLTSLVKYDTPVLVTTKQEEVDRLKVQQPGDAILPATDSEGSITSAPGLRGAVPAGGALGVKPPLATPGSLPPLSELQGKETEELLSLILPPRQWEVDGKLWVQSVSTTPATAADVQQLQEQLDMKLQEHSAFENGICPMRRELYTQCFDELIRQVTINCSERGLLLYRVRHQITATLHAYQRLYTSACAYGVRKALMAEEQKMKIGAKCEERRQHLQKLRDSILELQQEVEQLQVQDEQTQQEHRERHQDAKQIHQDNILILKKKLEETLSQATHSKK